MHETSRIKIAQLTTPFGFAILKQEGDDFSIKLSTTPASEPDNELHMASEPLFQFTAKKLMGYFNDPSLELSLADSFPIETLAGTPYQKRVWQAISQIPVGEVRSYSEVADTINSCPRATANACGANHLPIFIPCHRVVAKQGLGGFMRGKKNGLTIKKWLLRHEGIHYE